MTITVEIGERSFAVAPYMLGDLRRAAPHIDRVNELAQRTTEAAQAGKQPGLADLSELARALVEVIAVGIGKIDPAMTADAIEDMVDMTFIPSLQAAVFELLKASGLAPKGEAKAPSRRAKGAKV
jgi:hypothetical protein